MTTSEVDRRSGNRLRSIRVCWMDTTLPAVTLGRRKPDGRVRPLFTRRTAHRVLRMTQQGVQYGIDAEMLPPEAAFRFRWEGDRVVCEGGPDERFRFTARPRNGRYRLLPDDDWHEVTPPLPRSIPDGPALVRLLERPSPDRTVHIHWIFQRVPEHVLVEALTLAVARPASSTTRFILAGVLMDRGGPMSLWASETKKNDPDAWVRAARFGLLGRPAPAVPTR